MAPEDIAHSLQERAERFYARPEVEYVCEAAYHTLPGFTRVEQSFVFPNEGDTKKVTTISENAHIYQTAVSALTSLARQSGLYAPRTIPHKVSIKGSTPEETRVSIDDQPIEGLYKVDFNVEVNEPYKVGLHLIAPLVDLDVDVLPENVTANVMGLYEALDIIERIREHRNKLFEDMEYAKKHSEDEEEVSLFKEASDVLLRFKPSR